MAVGCRFNIFSLCGSVDHWVCLYNSVRNGMVQI